MPTYRAVVGVNYPGEGGPGINVHHFRWDGQIGVDDTEIQDVIESLRSLYVECALVLHASASIVMPNEIIEDPYGSPKYYPVTGWTVTGTGAGSMLPLATSICLSWRTTAATRSGRGRTFLGPIAAEALEANGTIAPAMLTQLRAAAGRHVGRSEAFEKSAHGVYSPTDGVIRDIVSSNVRDTFAVLRSRRD